MKFARAMTINNLFNNLFKGTLGRLNRNSSLGGYSGNIRNANMLNIRHNPPRCGCASLNRERQANGCRPLQTAVAVADAVSARGDASRFIHSNRARPLSRHRPTGVRCLCKIRYRTYCIYPSSLFPKRTATVPHVDARSWRWRLRGRPATPARVAARLKRIDSLHLHRPPRYYYHVHVPCAPQVRVEESQARPGQAGR